MSKERDTHFRNFAEIEFRDLTPELVNYLQAIKVDNVPAMYRHQEAIKRILAQRSFDFADHIIKHLWGSNLDEIRSEGLAHYLEERDQEIGYERVPDMIEWPE